MNDDQKFDDLMSRLLDDEISDTDLSEFVELLNQDPQRIDELQTQLESAEMIAQTEDRMRQSAIFLATIQSRIGDDPFVDRIRSALGQDRHKSKRVRPVAWISALVAVAAAFLVWLNFPSTNQANGIAKINGLGGAMQWTGDGGTVLVNLAEGQELGGGTLESLAADSWIEVEFHDGSTLVLSGPSSLTIAERDQKELYLRRGDLSAKVLPQKAPMLIHTPTADLEVLGTQFNVDAESAATALTVNEGRVRVTRLADGSVTEVPADHHVVAAASRISQFRATPRLQSVDMWRSDLPNGVTYGNWRSKQSVLGASALLWRGCDRNKQEPVLLYVAAMSVSRPETPLVALRAGCKFRIRGRMQTRQDLFIGLTTQHLKGGFAGKHIAMRKADSFLSDGMAFDLEVRIDEFKPEIPKYPASPVGLGLYDWWCLTINEDAGLSVESVELIPNAVP